ncbi:MAG: hypothetical protein K2X87_23680 [Gemmataceae bacterium]|nr:hypothetical protein [Gemmataceae bacterium]
MRVELRCEALEDRCTPATFTVTTDVENNTPGDGVVSLREAVDSSNKNDPGAGKQNVVDFAAGLKGKAITLTQDQIVITKSVRIMGPGSADLTVKRNTSGAQFRLFTVNANTTVLFQGLTLRDGYAPGSAVPAGGGAIYSEGTLTVSVSQFLSNVAGSHYTGPGRGGAIRAAAGSLELLGTTLGGNGATYGGAVYAAVPVVMNDCVVTLNNAATSGGGLYFVGAGKTAELRGTEVFGNGALEGAGVFLEGATLDLRLQTKLYDNAASGKGGGVYANGGKVLYDGVTIGDNTASVGDGVYLTGGATTEGTNVVWNNDVQAP